MCCLKLYPNWWVFFLKERLINRLLSFYSNNILYVIHPISLFIFFSWGIIIYFVVFLPLLPKAVHSRSILVWVAFFYLARYIDTIPNKELVTNHSAESMCASSPWGMITADVLALNSLVQKWTTVEFTDNLTYVIWSELNSGWRCYLIDHISSIS